MKTNLNDIHNIPGSLKCRPMWFLCRIEHGCMFVVPARGQTEFWSPTWGIVPDTQLACLEHILARCECPADGLFAACQLPHDLSLWHVMHCVYASRLDEWVNDFFDAVEAYGECHGSMLDVLFTGPASPLIAPKPIYGDFGCYDVVAHHGVWIPTGIPGPELGRHEAGDLDLFLTLLEMMA